ncbi:hypothetical protein AB0B28_01470 [Glycomyces sp. NPDC046736]|uniref:NACHT domain-containing protein n=1 Tax=Glycomyces sp. NPDC046736 TaxID=3155615 RepID=UPI0033FC8318
MSAPLSSTRRTTVETTAIVSAVAAVFAASTAFLFSSRGSPLWIGFAVGALLAAGIGWILWRRVRSYICVLRYRSRIRGNRYMNTVMLLGAVSRALPDLTLEDVYVDVALRNDETDGEGQKVYGWSPGRPGERATLDDFLLRGDGLQFAIYGMPGSGKSTLLRSTAMRMSRTIRPRAPIPILVVLAHHTGQIVEDPDIDLAEIAAGARWLNRDDVPAHEVRRWLSNGRCVIMLDGLDEVPERHRPAIMLWAEQQHGGYQDCSLVVTSRELGFESARFDAADLVLEVCPLTRDQIDLFVANCYRAFQKGGELTESAAKVESSALLAGLRADPALYDLASTPLMLQLMVFVHRNSDDGLPASRGELYERMVQMLLHERRSRVKLSTPSSRLELGPKLRIVQRLAFEMMLGQSVQFDPLPLIRKLLDEFDVEVSAQEMLRDLRENGLLSRVESNSETYTFAHLSFQEYLAAKEIREQGKVGTLLDRIGQRWWRNTALFWASAYDPNPLIEACAEAGTAEAWSLAIELRNEAELGGGDIDPRLTDRIAAFLAAEHPVDSEEHQVACTEAIRLNLGDVEFSSAGTICVKPVGGDLYRMFAREELARGFHSSSHRFGPGGEVMGLWPSEVNSFIKWLSQFEHHGFSYQLPQVDTRKQLENLAEIRRLETGSISSFWAIWHGQVRPWNLDEKWIKGYRLSEQELDLWLRADWRFMMSRFDLTGPHEPARAAARQIRSACGALKDITDWYRNRVGSTTLPRDSTSPSAKALAAYRAHVDSFTGVVDELHSFAGAESVNLLAMLRLMNSNRNPPEPWPC